MHAPERPLVVVVRPGADPRRTASVLRWLRWLVPAALLYAAPVPAAMAEVSTVVTLDADSVADGPLSVADAIERALEDAQPEAPLRSQG